MYTNGKPLSVLVYARPDRMSDALLSLLSGMQMIKEIDRIQDPNEAISTIIDKKTDLVLLDMASGEEGLHSLIPAIKRANDNAYCLSVVDTVRIGRISQQNGADHVLLRGFSGNELLEVIFKAQAYQMQRETGVMQNEPTYILE
ncbi:MAG: response regulator transcription factor [Anaerolineaceae bacterium]|nr:response regulator transcription factor [Anaerolineaceae bacterium]